MDEQDDKRRGGWKPGQSGNPLGRPKGPQTVAQVLRAKVSPEVRAGFLIDMAVKAESETVRLAARLAIIERCDGKVPSQTQLDITTQRPTFDLSKLSLDRQRELLSIIRELRVASDDDDERALQSSETH